MNGGELFFYLAFSLKFSHFARLPSVSRRFSAVFCSKPILQFLPLDNILKKGRINFEGQDSRGGVKVFFASMRKVRTPQDTVMDNVHRS